MGNINIEITSSDGQAINGGVFFYFKSKNRKKKSSKVNEKGVNNILDKENKLEQACKFIVDLYDVFEGKYQSAQIKVQKLIVIANLQYIYTYGSSFLPSDTKYECNGCGFKIPEALSYTRPLVSFGECYNKKIDIDESEQEKINSVFDNYSNLSNEEKNVIIYVFRNFGSYDPVTLGQLLNYFKELSKNEVFEKQPPFEFFEDDFKTLVENLNSNICNCNNAIALSIIRYEQ